MAASSGDLSANVILRASLYAPEARQPLGRRSGSMREGLLVWATSSSGSRAQTSGRDCRLRTKPAASSSLPT
jgi:hypothetical protein